MPSIDNCPECNRNNGEQFPYKEQYNDGRYQQLIHVNRSQRRRTPVHDRLGKRIDPQEQLEAEANDRVSDESYTRDPEVPRIHDTSGDPNQWCPGGLTRSQKRRLQRMRDRERQEEDRARKE